MENEKNQFAINLVALRKQKGLTQSQLAEKFNYTDKTISKWENGDAVPDSQTLYALSQFFEVSMDSLYGGDCVKDQEAKSKGDARLRRNKLIITLLAVVAVWFVGVFVYVQLKLIMGADYWLSFIWAVPASCIVIIVFNSIWGKRNLNYIVVSVLVWTLILALHLQLTQAGLQDIWPIYFLGIPLQISIILWSQLKSRRKKSKGEGYVYCI